MDGGDGCTTLMFLISMNSTLKNSKFYVQFSTVKKIVITVKWKMKSVFREEKFFSVALKLFTTLFFSVLFQGFSVHTSLTQNTHWKE